MRRVLSEAREDRLKAGYRKHGVKIVFIARHAIGIRSAAFLTAGIARVPFGRFLAADAVAALVGVPVAFGVAFLFIDQLEQVLADVHRVERWLALGAIVVLAVWLGWLALVPGSARVSAAARGSAGPRHPGGALVAVPGPAGGRPRPARSCNQGTPRRGWR